MDFVIHGLEKKKAMAEQRGNEAEKQMKIIKQLVDKTSIDDPESIMALKDSMGEDLLNHLLAIEELEVLEEARKIAEYAAPISCIHFPSKYGVSDYPVMINRQHGLVYFLGEDTKDGPYRNDLSTVGGCEGGLYISDDCPF